MQPGVEPHTSLSVRRAGLLDRIDYRRIETAEDKDHLYAMRYRAYLQGGVMLPTASQRVSDRYDDAPNAWTFGIYVDGELCSSVRIHVLTSERRMSFATELFGDVLHPRLDQGEVFIDPARFVADPEKHRRFPELPYVTLRLAYLACDYFNADTGLAIVRTEHQAFYRRVFLHRTIAEPRSFPNLLQRAALLASPFRAQREQVMARFPIMQSTHFERQMLFGRRGALPAIDLPEFPFVQQAPISPTA